MFIGSLEKLQVKKASDGQWQIVLDDLIYSLSEFIGHISSNSFQLNPEKDGELIALEKKAMFLFVNGANYILYNNLLRQRELHQFNRRTLKRTIMRVAAMQSGINKLPNYRDTVYRVASCAKDSTSIYNGIGDGGLCVGTITTSNTFVGACRFAFVVVEHAPTVIWTAIKTLHAKVQPDSPEEVTFPLGTSFQYKNITVLDPKKIIAHIDSDAELKWIKIGSKLRPFIGLNLSYENKRLPDFYFLSMPRQFRQLILPPLTFFLERSTSVFKSYALKELEYIKRLPADRRFQEMWKRSLDSSGKFGQLPEVIYLTEAEEISKSVM